MTIEASPHRQALSTPEQSHCLPLEIPLGQRLRNLGHGALAIAGVSLALLGTHAIGGPSLAEARSNSASITNDLDDATPLPPPTIQPITPEISSPKVGVATGSWDDDGLGYHTLFKDIAAEGMTDVRLSYLGSDTPSIQEMQAEATSALANDEEPIISLPITMTPDQAATATEQLSNVNEFVVGNEVNSPLFSSLTPAQYVTLLAQTNAAIHAVRPDAETRGFALASGYHPIAYLLAAKQFADQNYGGLQNIMDTLDVHLYRTLSKDEQMLLAYMQTAETLPIVIGEAGYIVGDPDHPGADTLDQQAIDEISLYNWILQYPQIQSLDWFRFKANTADPFDTANIASNGDERPAYSLLETTLTGQ